MIARNRATSKAQSGPEAGIPGSSPAPATGFRGICGAGGVRCERGPEVSQFGRCRSAARPEPWAPIPAVDGLQSALQLNLRPVHPQNPKSLPRADLGDVVSGHFAFVQRFD